MINRGAMIVLLMACVTTAYAQDQRAPDQQQRSPPAVLSLWNRPIVTFRATVGGVEPEQRARNSRARINATALSLPVRPVTTQQARVGTDTGVLVLVGDDILFGVVPGDIDPESLSTPEQVATEAASRLSAALVARSKQLALPNLLRGVGLALLAVLLFIAAVRLILVAREFAIRRVDGLLRGRELAIAGIDILPTLTTVERATFRVLSWGLIGVCTYLALTFVLHLFPYTAPLGERLGEYLSDMVVNAFQAAIRSLPQMIAVIAVLLITRAVALWIARLLAEVEHGVRTVHWLAQEQARATRRITTGVVWVLGVAIAYSLLPWSGSIVFQGMSLVLGLGVSLASAGLVNHWISGLVVLYSRSYRVGDYVRIGETEGVVTEMGALATKLRTIRREEITIPNAVMTSDKLTNFTRLASESGAVLSVSIAIGYAVPWERVRTLLLEAAVATPGVRRDPAPRVLQWELTDFSVLYQLHVYLERAEERVQVRSELNSRILDTFAAAGVQIMTPHFESQPEKPVIAGAASLPQEAVAGSGRL
jgi:small-conductance mechanosensitive channel